MIPTWGTSSGRNGAGGIPSLLLDFSNQSYLLNGTGYAAFGGSPGITFSRGTNATMIDSTGTLTYAPSNQVLNSESFTATSWTGVGTTGLSSVGSNATVAPDGTTTADSLVEDALTSDHRINQSGMSGSANAGKYAFSVYLKAGTRTFARIQFDGTINAVGSSCGVNVNLLDGSFSTPTNVGNITSATATVTNVGNGWYRVGLLAALSTVYSFTGASVRIFTMQSLTGSTSFLGDGSNIFVWGAQFGAMTYETDPRAYNSTTPKNLLGFTEEFSNAAWVKANATVTANALADPNGYLNADKLVEDGLTAGHFISQVASYVATTPYTYSVYAKAAERQYVQIIYTTGSFGSPITAGFDLSGAGATVASAGATSSITALSNGWYRCSITATATITATSSTQIRIANSLSTTPANYLGDGTSGTYIWGAQLSDSASLNSYVYNPAAATASTAYYGPRFDYDPVTLAPLGLLIEEARTNLIFPSDANAGWSASPVGTVAVTANATTSPDGTTNATKLATNDTATGGHSWFKTHTGAINTAYCGSAYFKAEEYTRAQISFGNTGFASVTTGALFDLTGAGAIVATGGGSTATITPVGNGWYRCSVTATSDADGGTYAFTLSPKPASASTFNGNYIPAATGLGVYVYGVQVEAAGFATSFIPTVSAFVTRSADVATMIGNNFTNWYNQTTGTLAVTFDASANGSTTYVSASNGTITQNSIHIDNDSGNMRVVYYSGSAEVAALGLGAISTVNATNKIATAYAVNDFAASRNGGTVATDTSGALPVSLTQLNIGVDDRLSAIYYTSNHIKSISYYNTRLTNAQLQAVSA